MVYSVVPVPPQIVNHALEKARNVIILRIPLSRIAALVLSAKKKTMLVRPLVPQIMRRRISAWGMKVTVVWIPTAAKVSIAMDLTTIVGGTVLVARVVTSRQIVWPTYRYRAHHRI